MASSTILLLSDVRSHLRYPTPQQPTEDDAALQKFINAADEVLQFECDETVPRTYSERHDGGSFKIHLYHRPIIEVQNIQESWGWINYQLDFQDAGTDPDDTSMFGYSIDSYVGGEIARRTVASVPIPFIPGEKNLFVQYVAGDNPLPAVINLAMLELIAHWWQNSQLRAAASGAANVAYDASLGDRYTRDTESGVQNINVGVPARILELIKPKRRMPVIA